jgi:hypothetical protein
MLCFKRGEFSDNLVNACAWWNRLRAAVCVLVMGMDIVTTVDTGLPDQISGPPRGCISVVTSVAMLRDNMEGHNGLPPHRLWNASPSGHYLNLAAAW